MRKPRLNRLHDHADGERHAERRRVAAEEQAEAGRRQRVGGDQDALRKAGRAARPFQRALGLLGAELAVLHLAGDFVDHRNAPAVRAAAADAPHVCAPVRLQKNRRRKRRDVDLLHAEALRHALRRLLHAVGFAAVFQQKLRRRADNIQLLFVCLHTIPLCFAMALFLFCSCSALQFRVHSRNITSQKRLFHPKPQPNPHPGRCAHPSPALSKSPRPSGWPLPRRCRE